MADVDLRLLRYFIAVCEEGGFSRAARRLGMTQPALSRAVRTLEAAVGVELVVRTAQTVEITEAGILLLEEARELDERALAAVERVRTASRAPRARTTSATLMTSPEASFSRFA
ncbi:LysR family transcriptional regulator, partial [Streptomyces prunicolor]|uniref:LysR family transcriptional regulator n=1 Tax=Streptomyces prunicolor TaxID=67348 RepID=UPI0033E71688